MHLAMWRVIIIICAVLALSMASSVDSSRLLTVNSTNGRITGHWASGTCRKVREYLGIPYAKPPLGNLRFAAPQRFDHDDWYEAATFGKDCPLPPSSTLSYPGLSPQGTRLIKYFASGAGTPQGEDCLTLNIWSRPKASCGTHGMPVVVFFYGGRK